MDSHTDGIGDFAGGIDAVGVVTIKDSTIVNNGRSVFAGGGLAVGGTVTITNSTIVNNRVGLLGPGVGGGVLVTSGTAAFTNVTIADNDGGGLSVAPDSTVTMQNTILARNRAFGRGPDCGVVAQNTGAIVSRGHNIIGTTADCIIDLAPTYFVGDAGLGEFQDDGTPGHGHIPLTAESPAINSANAEACPARDQLGNSRQRRRGCDIGAVEFQPGAGASTSLGVSPASVPAGGSVSATWSGIAAPTPTDWIGLYASGAGDGAFLAWLYVSCSQTPGAPRASGSCTPQVPGGVAPGVYQLRLFAADGFTRLATSSVFSVTP